MGESSGRAIRLRSGIALVVLSWFPFAQIVIWVGGMSGSQATEVRATIWTVQVLVGFVGVALAGAETIKMARGLGWKRTPSALWTMFRTGHGPAGEAGPAT